jgi:3-deoxy-D-manno-octulosonic acid kinase
VGSKVEIMPIEGGEMILDRSRVRSVSPQCLNVSWWRRHGAVKAAVAGRGSAALIDAHGRQLVLRHYRRGGLVQKLIADRYWWRGAQRTRSFAEWHILFELWQAGVPVPAPVAAGYRRNGRWYTADILMEQIKDARSLAEHLQAVALPLAQWVTIGRAVRELHSQGVWHADLNAHNVLLDVHRKVWLIDFDRARRRKPGLWVDANLARLYRSIEKVMLALPAERFTPADWSALLSGYFAGDRRKARRGPRAPTLHA